MATAADGLRAATAGRTFGTILADPPWQFQNRTGEVAPEHRRLCRYGTMTIAEIASLPVADLAAPVAHLYLWVPNALLPQGLAVMAAWGFTYKANIVWHKVRKDGGSDGRGGGFLFPERHRIAAVRDARAPCAHPRRGPATGQSDRHAQARAFPQAGRDLSDHRGVQPGTAARTVRTRDPRRLDRLGQRSDRRLRPSMGDLCAQLGSRPTATQPVRERLREHRRDAGHA